MIPVLCINCRFYIGKSKCKAFTKKIPPEILEGKNDHSKPLPNQDNEIVFEPIKK